MTKICGFLLAFLFANSIQAQEMKTVTYFQNDSIKLDLDIYLPKNKDNKKLPVVLFAHGGGFSGGDRKSAESFCKYTANNGYIAVSMSYTLYMKGRKFSCDGQLTEKVKAIRIAVSEMWQATSFLIANADKYHIDTTKIFAAGISAGAEMGFHAAFWDYKTMNLFSSNLPENFKYAGFIGGSGAIMDLNLINEKTKMPMLLFHGNADVTVPYANAAHHYCKTDASGWLMLFGSYSVYNRLLELNSGVELVTFCGGGHEYSGYLFEKEPQYVVSFLNDIVAGKKMQSHTIIPTGKKSELSAAYKFCD